ncbi:MAG: BolA family transcriptional regulator [SAR324 cluster bacterium]|nr:BolA family transcriptional regulator [SAR324 cluster bacterium]
MTIQENIERKLEADLSPIHLEVLNESHKHNVPPGSESHFKVIIVSEKFEKKSLVEQHQLVNQILADDLAGPVHALSIQAKTPSQWNSGGRFVRNTPECLGGSQAEKV